MGLTAAASASAHWEAYVENATPGLERDWRASMQKQHVQLVQMLLDSGALKVAPGSLDHVMSLFQQFDQNGDGAISKEELVNVLQLLDDGSWTEERIEGLLEAADLNRDSKIQFGEFITWVFGSDDDAVNGVTCLSAAG